jgi:hypothetical protein
MTSVSTQMLEHMAETPAIIFVAVSAMSVH